MFRPFLGLLALLALGILFSPEISNSDFWWHLKTGEYVAQTHSVPDPDPFAFTTPTGPAEAMVRRFNLTHEWLAQVWLYGAYRGLGFAGVVVARTFLLLAFCLVAGVVVWRRGLGFDRALAAAAATAIGVYPFAADRPYLVTFLFVAIFIAVIDRAPSRFDWILPVIMLIWANSHGGFILGLAILGIWIANTLLARKADKRLFLIAGLTLAAAALNPNGLRVIPVLADYRHSFLTSTLAEWQPMSVWPPNRYAVLMAGAALALIYARRRVRLTDAMFFVLFSILTLVAGRNAFLIAFIAPIVIATYFPRPSRHARQIGLATSAGAVAALVIAVIAGGRFAPQLRAAQWAYPVEPVRFLREHKITGRMFNTYEYGGYLMWALWPQQRVFIDGRALSESVFADYGRILHNQGAGELLDRYGVDIILMNTFEYTSGVGYALAPALGEAQDPRWKLVYAGATGVIFMRNPPPDIVPIDGERVITAMQSECALHIEHQPEYPQCARALGFMYAAAGEPENARRWLALYLQHHEGSDEEAQRAFLAQ